MQSAPPLCTCPGGAERGLEIKPSSGHQQPNTSNPSSTLHGSGGKGGGEAEGQDNTIFSVWSLLKSCHVPSHTDTIRSTNPCTARSACHGTNWQSCHDTQPNRRYRSVKSARQKLSKDQGRKTGANARGTAAKQEATHGAGAAAGAGDIKRGGLTSSKRAFWAPTPCVSGKEGDGAAGAARKVRRK